MIASTWRYPADAYHWLLSTIAAKGDLMRSEDGKLCRERCNIGVTILEPLSGWPIPDSKWPSIAALDSYAEQLLSGENNTGFEYTYGERLRAYPISWWSLRVKHFDSDKDLNIDQIKYCINKLRASPSTRRAVAPIWIPEHDSTAKEVPCLQIVDFLLRSGKLNLTAFFRSWDASRAAPANMYGLGRLLQHVANAVGCPTGSLTIVAASGHIYED